MARFKNVFLGADGSSCEETELQCYMNDEGLIFICIEGSFLSFTVLDTSTAIKLSKALKYAIDRSKDFSTQEPI